MTHRGDKLCRLRPVEKHILDAGYRINSEGSPFSFLDFKGYAHGTVRNALSSLARSGYIYLVYRSTIAFYAVRGSGIDHQSLEKITPNPMGGHPLLFECLPLDDDAVHDLRLCLSVPSFYESLLSVGWTPSESNGDIALRTLDFPKGRVVKVRAHRTGHVTVIVGCSPQPFKVSEGLSDLLLSLDQLRDKLEHEYLHEPVRVPPIGSWKVVQWHHGVDGTKEFSGPAFNFTYEDWSGHLVRFYAKRTSAGRYRPRLERIESPRLPLSEIVYQLKGDAGGS